MPAASPMCSSTRCCAASSHYLREQAGGVPRHRHPCRRRPLRSRRRPRRAAAANGATASRACSRRRCRPSAAALLAPYLDVVGALNAPGRLDDLSRLAGAGARLAAAAGPAHRLRTGAAGAAPRSPAPCGATRASRRWRSTAGPRSRPTCRRRSGAAWCWSIRRSSRTTTSRASPRGSPAAHRKWPTGIYMLWYPIKGRTRAGRAGQEPAPARHSQDPARRADRLGAVRSDAG